MEWDRQQQRAQCGVHYNDMTVKVGYVCVCRSGALTFCAISAIQNSITDKFYRIKCGTN